MVLGIPLNFYPYRIWWKSHFYGTLLQRMRKTWSWKQQIRCRGQKSFFPNWGGYRINSTNSRKVMKNWVVLKKLRIDRVPIIFAPSVWSRVTSWVSVGPGTNLLSWSRVFLKHETASSTARSSSSRRCCVNPWRMIVTRFESGISKIVISWRNSTRPLSRRKSL